MGCKNHPETVEGLARCLRCQNLFCADCRLELGGQIYCADCKLEQVRDIQSGADTTTPALASVGSRFVAVFIDGLVFSVLLIPLWLYMGWYWMQRQYQPTFVENLLLGLIFAIPYTLYDALMLSWRGQTLGKMALKIRVVTPLGDRISAGQAWGRALTRFFMPSFLALVNYLPAFFTKQKTCVHDMVAGTRVMRAAR